MSGTLSITYKNELSTKLSGKLVNGEATANADDKATGTDKGLFSWTGYEFDKMTYTSKAK